MKTINLSHPVPEVEALLNEARSEDIIVRGPDGTEFMVSAVDDFDEEIVRTRRNARLMAFLDERAKQPQTISLGAVKSRLKLAE